MPLKRTGGYTKALFAALGALAFFGYEAVVVAYLAQVADWGALFNPLACLGFLFLFVLLVANVLAVALPVALFWQERTLHAVRANLDAAAPVTRFQPDRALALRNGETLTLTRRARSGRASGVIRGGITLLLLALASEAMLVPVLPAIRGFVTSLVPLMASTGLLTSPPSPLDWLTVAFPLAFLLACVPLLLIARSSDRLLQIKADDQGVTLRHTRRRARFIPWNDIQVFLRGADSPIDTPVGGYFLWGREHYLELSISARSINIETPTPTQGKTRPEDRQSYTFDGGYDQYVADARRLLATVHARSGAPLRARAVGTKMLGSMKRRFPTIAVELDDALAVPLAGPPWQPAADLVTAAPPKGSLTALLALVPRLPRARLAATAGLWLLLFGLFFAAFAYWLLHPDTFDEDQATYIGTLIGVGIVALLVPIFAYIYALAQQRNRLPTILVDDLGITRKTLSTSTTRTLPWTEVRAWVVLPPKLGDRRGPTYFVFTDGNKLTWREPEDAKLAGRGITGDRRAAYRERAERLHALIAVRTGLPLRELGLERPEPAVV